MNQSNFNAEAHSIIPQSCLLLHPGLITKAILTTAYIVLLIAACTVNTIVIYLVRTCKDLRQSTFNHLIINMAVADIMDVCFSMITSLLFMFVGVNWISGYRGKISCKLVCFSVSVSIGLSISALVIMSVDRYMAIVRVMTNPISSATTKKCIALSWIVSVLVGVPVSTRWIRERVSAEVQYVGQYGATIKRSIYFTARWRNAARFWYYIYSLWFCWERQVL